MKTGEKIRGIRLLKGFSQENMAELLKISRNAHSEIERDITDLSESRLKQIAEVLKVSTQDIDNFEEKRSLFFENCSGIMGLYNTKNKVQNTDKDLQHRIEILELQLKNQQLAIEKEKAEKEKVMTEMELLKLQLKNR